MSLNTGINPEKLPPGGDQGFDAAFKALLDLAPMACAAIDADGTFIFWSSTAAAMFGWTVEDIIGQPVSFISPCGELQEKIRETGRSGSQAFEIECRSGSGERIELNIWVSPVSASGERRPVRLLFMVDVSERKFLEAALLEASEREQRRIGQELHDHLAQHLLGAAFGAKALAGTLDREHSPHAPALHDLARLINDAVYQVRDVSRGLHPVEFDEAGLMSAIQELASRVSHTIPCSFECERPVLVEDARAALHAYRIVQEVVAYGIQHTGATSVRLILETEKDHTVLRIVTASEKEGELTAEPSSLTVRTLLYRAQAMGARLTFEFQPATGTTVVCRFSNCHE